MRISIGLTSANADAHAVFLGREPKDAGRRARIAALEAAGRLKTDGEKVKTLDTDEGLLLLIGRPKSDDVRHLRRMTGLAVRAAKAERARTLAFELDSYPGALAPETLVRTLAEAALEADYQFSDYLESPQKSTLEEVCLLVPELTIPLAQALEDGVRIGEAVCAARTVVNRTSRDMTPELLADWAVKTAADAGCETELLDQKTLESLHADALLSVAAGAEHPPVLAVLRYKGDPEHPERVTALIGKGITFDSGGLSLKSKTGMLTMHHDMSGAAVSAAAVSLIAQAGLPINLTAVLPIAENMLSPVGYRPGDVIHTMNGKTVLIKSTDAEGRLVMADAMTYAIRNERAGRLIDLATLTGGAVAAYGPLINAIAVNDETLRGAAQRASGSSGELVWEMPLLADYRSYLEAEQADLANSSNGAGSSMVNAALFLETFAEERPWLHIDCAGTAWTNKADGCFSYGATGAATLLLYDLIRDLSTRP